MNIIHRTSNALIVPLVVGALALNACASDGDIEAGETTEEVGEATAEGAEEAGKATAEGAEEVGEAIEEGVSGNEEPQPER